MNAIKTILLAGTATLALAGCDQLGSPLDTLTGKRPAPDEFRVVTRKPLQMPGSASLPEPRLGERSPLEHDPGGDARALLTGTRSGGTGAGSAGESALVAAATSNTTTGTAGSSLAEREAALERNKPYEAPTVMELLNLDGRRAEDVLDPNAEARKLRTGAAAKTPVNPNDRPEVENAEAEAGDEESDSLFDYRYPATIRNRGSQPVAE